MPRRAAFSSIAWPSAMSLRLRPRCQNRIVSSSLSRPGLPPGDDLAELGVQRLLGELARLDVGAQRAERPAAALAPVVDDELVHDVGQRELDGAHRAVGHHQRAGLDPLGPQQRLGPLEPRGLDHDVGAAHDGLPVVAHASPGGRGRARAARRRPRGSRGAASARGSRRARRGGRAGARSSRPCRARRCGRARARPARARWRAPSAVTAPVRMSVRPAASITACGTPVRGS